MDVQLKKGVGFWTVLALAIGSIMGTGLFFGAAIGARYAGNLVIVSWILMSVVALYVSACFSELVSMFPKSGGVYEFGKQAYGRFISFLLGWTAWLFGNVGTVLLIVAAIDYLIPSREARTVKLAISLLFIIALNIIAYIGMNASSATLIAFAAITISVLVAVVAKGMFYIRASNLTPFLSHPLSTMFTALFFMIEGFFGWEAAAYLAEETQNPEKTIPKALMIATLSVSILGIAVYAVTLGIIPWQQLIRTTAPLTDISRIIFGGLGSDIISLGIYLTLIGSAAAGIITIPRLVLALARDKLFLQNFRHINPRFKTPDKAVIFQTIALIIILFLGFGNYQILLSILVPLGIIMYTATLLAVTILRFRQPQIHRPFKTPMGKIMPALTSALFIGVLAMWVKNVPNSVHLLNLSISLILIGIPLYLLLEFYYDPQMITNASDLLAYAHLITEKITIPKKIKEETLSLVGDVRGKTILEFGAGVGTLTTPLLEAVGPKGILYAIHFSKNELRIAHKRAERKKWQTTENIYGTLRILHDPESLTRIDPRIKYADGVVSSNVLSYIQEPEKILKQIHNILPNGGKICFIETVDYFHLLPNKTWLNSSKNIENMFRKCGLSVRVKRVKGIFWNYAIIYGIKYKGQVAVI